ncbi:MAG: TRAP transporter small permease subunit [Burkholderiales bacterium]|nr:TRAP transporter small permease subunit [Burkholderiales bacterium]
MHNASLPASGNAMHRFRGRYGLMLEWVVMFLMVALAVEVVLGIVFRASGHALVWYDEVASVLLAWLTFYGSALASVKRAHIGCPEVVEQLPSTAKRVVHIGGQILVIVFFALLCWVGLSIMPFLVGDALVSLPWVPMNLVQSVIPISAALILVAETMNLIELISPPAAVPTLSGPSH